MVACFDAIWETLQMQIHKKKIHENTEDMFEDFLNCSKYSAFF